MQLNNSMGKILILGKKGWLGSRFYDYLKEHDADVIFLNDDINSLSFLDSDISIVVNFAASTSIDWVEKNKSIAFYNNTLGAINVARLCKLYNAKLVFLSSACIYQSKKDDDIRFEGDTESPGCFYTETKLMSERLIRELLPSSLIVRLRLPFSSIPHPKNALNKLSKYKYLINSQESATIIEDFFPRFTQLILENKNGSYNLINEGTIAPSEIGTMLGTKFEIFTKEDLDKQMAIEGRAHRVHTIVGTHFGYLPPIRDRIGEIVNQWKHSQKM